MRRAAILFAACLAVALGLTAVAFAQADPAADEQLATCRHMPPGAKMTINIHPNATLSDVALWASGFTCKNIIFTEGAGAERLTIVAPAPMSAKEAYELFLGTLSAFDLTAIEKGNTVVIKEAPGKHRCPVTTAGAPAPFVPPPPLPPPTLSAPAPDPALATGIQSIDATHYTITRATLDSARLNDIARTVRIVPAMEGGKPTGMKVYAIRPGSMFALLGFQNGDLIQAVNDKDISKPDQALETYTTLRNANLWHVTGLRRGAPFELEIRVIP